MKGRSVKLREAHKDGDGAPALCSVVWDADGSRLVTASSSDPAILIHDVVAPNQPAKPPRTLRHHKDGVTCLALSPDSACLASGSVDHSVKLYDFPGGDFQNNVTRFTLPIRSLSFNKSGSLLAAAGDDDGIKLIATIDSSISRVLKGHKGSVTGLAFDPKNEYLASVDNMGTVTFWELSSGKALHTLKAVAPNCGLDTLLSNVLCWSPDGETLAVAGLRNDVVMYDRDTAEKLFTLKGDHEKAVCFMSWSPNGKYMATSSLDRQILIWDIDQRQDIERQKFEERVSYLAWKPNGNALAVIDVAGRYGVWESPVPTCMKSPTDGAPSLNDKNGNGLLFFDEDEPEPNASGTLDDINEDSFGESIPVSRKRLRKHSLPDDTLDDGSDGPDDILRQIESRKRSSKRDRIGRAKEESGCSTKICKSSMQEPFQPCSTPAQAGKRRFLCYNMLGSVTTIENEGQSHIEVDFHDTGRGPRVPSMTDYFGFTMAALSETGSVFANPGKGEKKTSTLMYRPFSSWANNSEWSMRFEAEEVKVVALGTGWVAAFTDLGFVRIFSEGGLQRHIFSLSGPVVTAAGFQNELAVVIHASDSFSSGDQMLEVQVFNIFSGTLTVKSCLPLTPGSYLSWFGFSEEGRLSAYDSKGLLRVFNNQFGGSWFPLFSSEKVKQSEEENYWVVGLNSSKLFCIVCKPPDSYPLVTPKPILTLLDFSVPLASSDLGASDLENELILINLHLSETQKKIEEMAAGGLDTTTIDDEVFDMEAARDRCILRLIASCCNSDKLVRATELVKLLSLEKSVKGAIKLVTALKLPILAERFSSILEERMLSENTKAAAASNLQRNITSMPMLGLQESLAKSERNMTSIEPTTLPQQRLPSAQFSKQDKLGEQKKMGEKMELSNQDKVEVRTKLGQKKLEFSKQGKVEESSKLAEKKIEPCKNSKKVEEKKLESKEPSKSPLETTQTSSKQVTNHQPTRPSNPFAKASNNQENTSSLLSSLKKMKKVDSEGKAVTNKNLKV